MSESAYARAGVDTGATDRAVEALVGVLRTIDTGRASRAVPLRMLILPCQRLR